MEYKYISRENWDKVLMNLLLTHDIFASASNDSGIDYELIKPDTLSRISYNKPKPATPLKTFFLPFRENVTSVRINEKPRIILGIPNCDIEGLSLLDEIYLDKQFVDIFYKNRRLNTLLISADCIGIQKHCHCSSYNVKPYSEKNGDLALINLGGEIIFRIISEKGDSFLNRFTEALPLEDSNIISALEKEQKATVSLLGESNKGLPDYRETGNLIDRSDEGTWKKYSSQCVSCGACTAICPTCSCFLLIDKPGFEKIKQMDACQYPGFERVAGGEDALFELHNRFRNRYMCKYTWKPEKFTSTACTGCGRCIEACIGKINKNEIFMELAR